MGLRFRKSITLCKGVKLNFGKTGMSVTTGMRGFHNTYNFNTGKTTTSIGIPGTGLSYVTTHGGKSKRKSIQSARGESTALERGERLENQLPPRREESTCGYAELVEEMYVPDNTFLINESSGQKNIPFEKIQTIHYAADAAIDWTEILISDRPSEDCEDYDLWEYCHERAYQVLNGDIDTYLEIIKDINPLDDLLDYGFGFLCGTDDPNIMVVEFQTKQEEIMPPKEVMCEQAYFELLQDYICSCALRTARDIFALLPVSKVIVHAVSEGDTILSVEFERRILLKLKFQGCDASNLVSQFKHNMIFNRQSGFSPVDRLDG